MEDNNTRFTIMAVHAHPDDEVVFTGGTLPLYHDRGVRTVLVTATGGEEGEIHDPELDPEEARPRLGDIRREELRRAVEILQIDNLELLNYRDSGMAGTEANERADNFRNADREEATRKLVALVRRYKPQILVTYDENGAYGHPDHIMCNIITQAAYEKAADPEYAPELGEAWAASKLYYTHWPQDRMERARQMYKERGLKWFWEDEEERLESDPEHQSDEEGVVTLQKEAEENEPPAYVPPPVTTRLDVSIALQRKMEAIYQHRTQFSPDGPFMVMPPDIAEVALGEEHYSLVKSRAPAAEQEDDLLAGLE